MTKCLLAPTKDYSIYDNNDSLAMSRQTEKGTLSVHTETGATRHTETMTGVSQSTEAQKAETKYGWTHDGEDSEHRLVESRDSKHRPAQPLGKDLRPRPLSARRGVMAANGHAGLPSLHFPVCVSTRDAQCS